MGYHDLMIESDNDATFAGEKMMEMARFLAKLGYEACAFNVSATAPLGRQHRCQLKLPDISAELPPKGMRMDAKLPFRPLSRITVTVEDSTHVSNLDTAILGTYDIVAARPTTEKAFEQCCRSARLDVISLDLSRRLPFYPKMPLVAAAIKSGLHFEVTYGAALRDAGARRHLLANARALLRATKGRALLISSEAERAMELRAPADVVNLSALFGLGHGGKGRACLVANPAAVVSRAAARRGEPRAAEVRAIAKLPPGQQWAVPRGADGQPSEGGGGRAAGGGAGDDADFLGFATGAADEDEDEEDEDDGERSGEGAEMEGDGGEESGEEEGEEGKSGSSVAGDGSFGFVVDTRPSGGVKRKHPGA